MTDKKLAPAEAVRASCTQCLCMKQFNTEQVRDCEGNQVSCSFFPYRLGKRPPVMVFRKHCITDCMNGYKNLVSTCTTDDCPSHPYRFGNNPALTGKVRGASLTQKRSKEGVGRPLLDQNQVFMQRS